MSRRDRQQDKRDTKRAESVSRLVSYQGPWSISLRYVDRDSAHGYPWPEDSSDIETSLLGRLAPLTQYDIENVPDFDGFEHRSQHVDGLEDHAQARIITLELQKRQLVDTDLYRFALGPSARLWGFLEEHVFYPMWWDPEHRVCSYDEDLAETNPADVALARRAADIVTRGMR